MSIDTVEHKMYKPSGLDVRHTSIPAKLSLDRVTFEALRNFYPVYMAPQYESNGNLSSLGIWTDTPHTRRNLRVVSGLLKKDARSTVVDGVCKIDPTPAGLLMGKMVKYFELLYPEVTNIPMGCPERVFYGRAMLSVLELIGVNPNDTTGVTDMYKKLKHSGHAFLPPCYLKVPIERAISDILSKKPALRPGG